ncbi:MAG TPA: DUF2341 domain-containing protein, partial [Crenalkalicoccus sp.]|nr:DUF2341 domain-containing protein [Crenalkalicoccus sp.]
MRPKPARSGRLALLAACLILLLAPASARAWWDGNWAYRMKVTAGGPPPAEGAPATDAAPAAPATPVGRSRVLVRLHQGIFNFNNTKEDGTDIRFVAADDHTPLRFSVEKYDSLVDQVGLFWVDIPDLQTGGAGTPFYIYWGNRNAPPAGDAKATFDAETVLAYDFVGDAGNPRDATGYGNNATSAARRDDGLVGFGERFDGTATVRIPASPSLGWAAGGPVTWSFWVRPDAANAEGVLYQAREGDTQLTIGLSAGAPYAELANAAGAVRTPVGSAIAAESWHLVAVVAANDRLAVWLDGAKQGEAALSLP